MSLKSQIPIQQKYKATVHQFFTFRESSNISEPLGLTQYQPIEVMNIGKSNINIYGELNITGDILPFSCNVYDLGSSNYRWRDLYLSGNTIDLGGTRISRNNTTGGMKISSKVNDTPLDFTAQHITALGTLYASNITIAGNALIIEDNGNVGMGTAIPTQKLDVRGNIYTSGNIVCSNISVIGDFVRLDTITSNTEQIVVENAGTGPALKVTQSGANSVAEFYDSESGVALFIGNNGNIGIGTNAPLAKLDLIGNLNLTGNIYKNGDLFAGGDTMPIGIIAPFYGTTVSDVSWLICDGSTYTRSNYIELADFLGVNPVSSTFQVPDLRDKYLKGKGTGSAVRDVGGSNLKTLSIANLPAHTHTGTTDGGGSHNHSLTWTNNVNPSVWTNTLNGTTNYGAASGGYNHVESRLNSTTGTEPNHTHTFTTASTGSGTAFDIQPPYTVVNYIIKAKNNQYTTPIRSGDYWSNSNNEVFYQSGNIGIGTTKPQQLLDVNGNAVIRGNIGIGTNVPQQLLDVNGNALIRGNVGIGTANPQGTLHVEGSSYFSEDVTVIGDIKARLYGNSWMPPVKKMFSMSGGTASYLDVSTGNTSAKGFYGGFTDGRYAYLIPWYNGTIQHGILTRVDLQNFTASGVTYLNVAAAGNTNAVGFYGGFTDGKYAYLVPNYNTVVHGIFTRIDLKNFTTTGVTYLDVSTAGNTGAKGFRGGFTDGRYAYLVPSYNGATSGLLTRVDLLNFTTTGVTYLDVSTAGNTNATGFESGFINGQYAYLVPFYNSAPHGIFTRIDLKNFTTTGVAYLDVSAGGNTNATAFASGFTDGHYGYLVPSGAASSGVSNSLLTRVDLLNFTITGVSYLDVANGGNTGAKGFTGGFTDGNFGYLVPYNNTGGVGGGAGQHDTFTRFDLNNFTTTGVSYLNVSTAGNTGAKGFRGGFTDGNYAYLVPLWNGTANHGILTRILIANIFPQGY